MALPGAYGRQEAEVAAKYFSKLAGENTKSDF
jgi:hypothetical protein